MRIVFNISVGMDVPTYVQAGEALDRITTNLKEVVGPNGEYDLSSFQAHHTRVRKHPIEMGAMIAGDVQTAYSDGPRDNDESMR